MLQNQPQEKIDHSKSSEASDLECPRMTLNDLEALWVIYSMFIGVYVESGTYFVVNKDTEAWDIYKLQILLAEMSHKTSAKSTSVKNELSTAMLHSSRRVSTRQTQWCQFHLSIFKL